MIFVQNPQQPLQICWQVLLSHFRLDLLTGLWGSQAEESSWQAKVHIKPWQSRVIQVSVPCPWSCTQCPHWASWLNGTPVSPWSADKLNSCTLYLSIGIFSLIPSGSQGGLTELCPSSPSFSVRQSVSGMSSKLCDMRQSLSSSHTPVRAGLKRDKPQVRNGNHGNCAPHLYQAWWMKLNVFTPTVLAQNHHFRK